MDISELTAHITSLADLEKVVILDDDGDPAARIGWTLVLFFDEGQTLPKRLQANDVLRDVLKTFPGCMTHYHPENSERLKPIGDLDIAAACDAEAEATSQKTGRNGNDKYSADVYGFEGGQERMEPAPYYIGILAAARQRPSPSFVTINIPIAWQAERGFTPVLELYLRWCAIVKPTHGTASPGLVLMQGGGSNALKTTFHLMQRFPGLDYVTSSRWTAASRKQPRTIRTIGWLTAIDDGFVETLGGIDRVRATLEPEGVALHEFDGGLVIQAGPKPVLGDRNRGIVPQSYRAVAHLLQPLVFEPIPLGLFYPLPGVLDPKAETAKWLHRFD